MKRPMVEGVNLPEALAALRALTLPPARIRYLAALIVADPARAELIVSDAADEAERVRREGEAILLAELAQRAAYEARQAQTTVRTGFFAGREGGQSWGRPDYSAPPERPVRVRYVTPTKPKEEKPERKPEQSEGFERTVAHREKTPHGLARYKGGCRCDVCKAAKIASRKSAGKRAPNGSEPQHGTLTRYVKQKCRCELCRAAMAKSAREARARKRAKNES